MRVYFRTCVAGETNAVLPTGSSATLPPAKSTDPRTGIQKSHSSGLSSNGAGMKPTPSKTVDPFIDVLGLETVAPRNNDSTISKLGRTLQKPQPTPHLVSPHNTQNSSNVPPDPFKDCVNKMLASSDSRLPRRKKQQRKTATDLLSKTRSTHTRVMGRARSRTCQDPFKGLESKLNINWQEQKVRFVSYLKFTMLIFVYVNCCEWHK